MPSISAAHGSQTIVGSAVQLTTLSVPLQYGTSIKAPVTNTATVYVGLSSSVTPGTTAATDGYPVGPGEEVFFSVLFADNVGRLYVVAATPGQKVFWVTF